MEEPKISTCRTCLGPLEFSRNLCDNNFKRLLDLLHKILDVEVQIKGGVFTVCQSCESKLTWVLEFKSVCEKSLEKLKNEECKEERIDLDDYDLCLDNNGFDIEANYSSSDSDFLIEHVRRRKKEAKKSSKAPGKVKPSKRDSSEWRRSRSKQYPANEVLQAITDSASYFTDVRHRSCIHCPFVATTEKLLRSHMRNQHWDSAKTWCNRCNLQTENLEYHKSTTKCCEDRCKFCNKKCDSLTRLTEHLRTHCHEIFKKNNDNLDFDWDNNLLPPVTQIEDTVKTEVPISEENASTLWFKSDDFSDNENTERNSDEIKNENESNEIEKVHRHKKRSYPQNSDDEDGPAPKKLNKNRLQQFSHEEIEKAIKETMRPFHTNRQCIICGELTKNSKFLSGHMTKAHRNKRDNWCSRCNSMVNSIDEHKLTHRNDVLKCSFCERSFHTTINLKEHLKLHSGTYGLKIDTTWYSCKHCPQSFSIHQEYKEHRCKPSKSSKGKHKSSKKAKKSKKSRGNSGEGGGKRLPQFPPEEVQQAINDTMKSFHENRTCIFCGFLARYSRTLSLHVSKLHREMFDRWCSRCNTAVENLPAHKEGHRNDVLKCRFCGKSFNTVDHLKEHLKCHCRTYTLDTVPKFYNCKVCPNTYSSEKELMEHDCKGPGPQPQLEKKVNHPEVCPICKIRVKNLKAHTKNKHEPKTSSPAKGTKLCNMCGKTSSTNYDLQMHMMIHTGEMPHKCSFCDKRFIQRTSLLVHEKRHTGEKPHVCHVCGKGFVTTGDLRRHEEVHEGGPVKCTVCDKQFCRPGVLKLHMRRHTGENPFICIECGVSFHRKSILLRHIKKHSNERLAKCSFCEKDFKHKHQLKEHERIHKGIKPYKCSQCSYTCEKSCSLILHMKQHPEDLPQADRPHKCLFCYKQYTTNAMLMSHINNKHRESITNIIDTNV